MTEEYFCKHSTYQYVSSTYSGKIVRTRYVLGVNSMYYVCTSTTYSYKSNSHFISGTTAGAVLSNSLPSQHHGDPPQCSKDTGEQPAQYPAQEQHNSIIHGMYLVHTKYALSIFWFVLSMYQVLFKGF